MVKYPDRAPYWVPFLIKTTEDTKSLCMQFESVVTNNSLSFGSIPFLTVKQDIKDIFDMSRLGGVDWQSTFDDLSAMADSITVDDLKMDMEDIAAMGAALASSGGINERFFQDSRVGRLFNGAPQTIYSLYNTAGQFMDNMSRATAAGDILGLLGANDSTALIHLFVSLITSRTTRTVIIRRDTISTAGTLAVRPFAVMSRRRMTTALSTAQNGLVLIRLIPISILIPHSGNRHFPIQRLMPDGHVAA